MLQQFRASLKRRKREKNLDKKLKGLAARFPDIDWLPFQNVTRFFSDKSMSALEEQAFLYRLACTLPPHAVIIEIGSWIGHSTCLLGVAMRGDQGRIYAIDAFNGMTTIAYEIPFYQNFLRKVSTTQTQRELFDLHLRHFNLTDRVTAVPADSAQAAALLPADFTGADLAFIDGGHALDVVRQDIALYVPRVKSGGIVVFHDFSSACGVPQAVWEAIQRDTFSELIGIYATLLAFRKK